MRFFSMRLPALLPLTVLVALGYGLFMGSLFLGAARVDHAERLREQALVANALGQRLNEVGETLTPYVIWDDALEHLDNRFDPAWADTNIGRALTHVLNFRTTYVLDASDRPQFAADVNGRVALSTFGPLSRQAAPLVAAVRAVEAERPARPQLKSIQRSGIALLDGRPVTVTASLVRTDFGTRHLLHARAPIVLAVAPVEGEVGRAFADRFLLDDARVMVGRSLAAADGVAPVERSPPELARVELARDDASGRGVTFVWRPKRPGADLLQRSMIYLLMGSFCLMGGAAILLVQAWRANQGLVRSKEHARHLALHDPLTGLANRRLFGERLSAARRSLSRDVIDFAVLCLDLDDFKEVNDAHGHEAGDELIREVGMRLAEACRADEMVARLGGDEFGILVANVGAGGAAALAQRLIQKLSGDVLLSRGQAQLSCSIGLAFVSDLSTNETEILRQADMALYRAKAQGRGRYCFFEPEMDQAIKARKALEADLRAAVAQGQIKTVYQPLVRADGVIVGAEALARWAHPERGEVSPSLFIPLAEDCDLIGPIGAAMFRQACQDSRDFGDLRVAVNVSPVQLRRPGMIEQVKTILAETGADPRRLDLEITEGCLLRDDVRTHDILNALRELGFQLVLDDFGTGYSSLSYLHRYPVKKIKLDRSFIVRLDDGEGARLIVSALIQLAKGLNLDVLAEGVETVAQLEALTAMGCKAFQGYLFSKPCSKAALAAMLGAPLNPDGRATPAATGQRRVTPSRPSVPVRTKAAIRQA
jgi:diguanylate cyclase (GGDEF)-like protein